MPDQVLLKIADTRYFDRRDDLIVITQANDACQGRGANSKLVLNAIDFIRVNDKLAWFTRRTSHADFADHEPLHKIRRDR